MRQVAIVALVGACGQLVAAGQLRREPLIVSMPYEALNRPDSPIELSEGQLSLGGARAIEQLIVTLKVRRTLTPIADVIIRLAAGLFEDGMVTYRLRSTSVDPSESLPRPIDPSGWRVASFVRLSEDPMPNLHRVGRNTRIMIAVEQARDTYGVLIYDNPDCREQLWKALGGS